METMWFDRDGLLFEVEPGSEAHKQLVKAGVMRVQGPGKNGAPKTPATPPPDPSTDGDQGGDPAPRDLDAIDKLDELKAYAAELGVEVPSDVRSKDGVRALIRDHLDKEQGGEL